MAEFKIVCIGINRPAKRNCVNKVTAEKLYDAFSAFENDDSLNCAVLHGKQGIIFSVKFSDAGVRGGGGEGRSGESGGDEGRPG